MLKSDGFVRFVSLFKRKTFWPRRNAVLFLSGLVGRQCFAGDTGKYKFLPRVAKPLTRISFAQQGEDLVLARVIDQYIGSSHAKNGTYVDIGAYDAIDFSVTYGLYLKGWRGIAYDPSGNAKSTFGKYRKEDVFVQALAGSEDNSDADYYTPNGTSDCHKSLIASGQPGRGLLRTRSQSVNIRNSLVDHGIGGIDFLNLDTEGSELEILKALEIDITMPKIIAVEILSFPLDSVMESDVYGYLVAHGYRLVASCVITHFFVCMRKVDSPN